MLEKTFPVFSMMLLSSYQMQEDKVARFMSIAYKELVGLPQ